MGNTEFKTSLVLIPRKPYLRVLKSADMQCQVEETSCVSCKLWCLVVLMLKLSSASAYAHTSKCFALFV